MKILLCAATKNELSATIEHFNLKEQMYSSRQNFEIKYKVTGPGILNTTFHLQSEIHNERPDLIVNAGIAGAIDARLKLNEVVNVISESLGDFGAEDGDEFLNASELGLMNIDDFPFSKGMISVSSNKPLPAMYNLKSCHGTTVQKVHGNARSIENLRKTFPLAQIESMEGAAVFYVCRQNDISVAQIRSISNYVERRNRSAWQIPSAISSLNDFLIKMFST